MDTTYVVSGGRRVCRTCGDENAARKKNRHDPHRPRLSGHNRRTAFYLYEEDDAIIDWLISTGYGTSASGVVRKLLDEKAGADFKGAAS
jgi:hypothetical protein